VNSYCYAIAIDRVIFDEEFSPIRGESRFEMRNVSFGVEIEGGVDKNNGTKNEQIIKLRVRGIVN
jgi:hypothetical protein